MIPVLTRTRAKSLDEFGKLVHHSGEEYIHVLEGRLEVHTEFYDPIVLGPAQSVYIDSNLGHAYIAAHGCAEAVLLGHSSRADDQLHDALLPLQAAESGGGRPPRAVARPAAPAPAPTARAPDTTATRL